MDSQEDSSILTDYLLTAKNKILTHRFPYDKNQTEVEPRYEYDQIELAIVLYNQKGGEGQASHSENGIKREWRTEHQILSAIPRQAGVPS